MPKKRKEGNLNTTISIRWSDKQKLRRLAKPKKKTKYGVVYDNDAEIFNKVIDYYVKNNPSDIGDIKNTYPTKDSSNI